MSDDHRVTAPSDADAEAQTTPDDEATPALPPVEPRTDKVAPRDRPSQRRAGGVDTPNARRVRSRMTLRIPDDEVARPTSNVMPAGEPAGPAEPAPPGEEIKGTRIISVGPPPMPRGHEGADDADDATPHGALAGDEAGEITDTSVPMHVGAQREDSWTPYQPTVADGAPPTPRDLDPDKTGEYPAPNSEEIPVVDGLDETAEAAEPTHDVAGRVGPSSVPPSGAAPRDPSRPPAYGSSAPPAPFGTPPARSSPPSPPAGVAEALPPLRAPMRAMIQSDPEGEDVRFEDEDDEPEATTLSQPEARPSEPGDAPEVSVDDLVSVESLLPGAHPQGAARAATSAQTPPPPPGIPPMRPRAKSIPPPPASNPPPGAKPPLPLAAPAYHLTPPPAATPATPAVPPISQSPPPAPVAPSPPAQGPLAAAAQAAPPPAGASLKAEGARLAAPPQSSGALAPPPLTDAGAARKRVRPWWEELFNDDFIRASAKVTDPQVADEATFIEESLGVARDGMLLDLACGTGLHAIELTKRGYHVVGFDLSLAMLARASDEAHDREARLNFVQGDMRDMTFDEQFDGVYCWGTSFGYFDEEKNAQVIARVHKALRPGGVFLLDVVNRDYIMKQSPSLAWFEGEGCICMDEMMIDWITSRLKVKRTMMMDDGRTKEIEYSIRVYALHELGRVLHEQGFRVAEVSGRTATPGVFFGCDSPRTLILAAKR